MYVLTRRSTVLKFPYSLSELRKSNPDTSFPSSMSDGELATWGIFPVTPQAPPEYSPATETLRQADPVLADGEWLQAWSVEQASEEEVALRLEERARVVRTERNRLLADCDWTQLPDAPVMAANWVGYRQALRDISDQEGFPWEVVWPTAPEA